MTKKKKRKRRTRRKRRKRKRRKKRMKGVARVGIKKKMREEGEDKAVDPIQFTSPLYIKGFRLKY